MYDIEQQRAQQRMHILVVGQVCEQIAPCVADASMAFSHIGGAANIARMLGELGVNVGLQCVTGNDAHAVDTQLSQFLALLPQYDMAVVSDFPSSHGGNLAPMMQAAAASGRRMAVVPSQPDFARYAGASLLISSESMLRMALRGWDDEAELTHKVQRLSAGCSLGAVLVARAGPALSLYTAHGPIHFPMSGATDVDALAASAAYFLGACGSSYLAAVKTSQTECASRMERTLEGGVLGEYAM